MTPGSDKLPPGLLQFGQQLHAHVISYACNSANMGGRLDFRNTVLGDEEPKLNNQLFFAR